MKSFLEFFGTFALLSFCIISIIKDHKKHPPIIEKGKIGKKNRECYIVSVWICGKTSFYRQHNFVKRKNGKYRLKFWPVHEWIWGVLLLAFYIEMIREFPEFGISVFLVLFLYLLSMWALLHSTSIRARIYFHKYMKTQTKGKRR